jgi:hypothetical protein
MLRFFSLRILNKAGVSCALTLLAIVCLNMPAAAGPVLKEPITSGGIVRYEDRGNHHRILGSGIKLGDLAFGGDVLRLFGSQLSFSGGKFLDSNQGNSFWGAGGQLSLKGCADLNGDSKCGKGDFRGTLMTASFLSLELVNKNGQEVLEATIIEHLSPQLAALLKLSSTTQTGELELTLASLSNGKWWARDTVEGGFLGSQAVPETSTILLLGVSLAFLGTWWLRSKRAQCPSDAPTD